MWMSNQILTLDFIYFFFIQNKGKKINKNKAVSIEHLLGLKVKKYVPWPESPCSYAI